MENIKCSNCNNEISKKAPTCPSCGHPNKKANHLSGGQVLFGLLIGIGTIWWLASGSMTKNSPSVPSASNVENQIKNQVIIKNLSWHKSGFDNVMMVNVTFENKSSRAVKDIELTCEHFSNSGTKIDSNSKVIYEIIKPGKSKSMRDFNMGFIHSQASETNCRITDMKAQ